MLLAGAGRISRRRDPRTNIYTVEKEGLKKLIFQTPWYDEDGADCQGGKGASKAVDVILNTIRSK